MPRECPSSRLHHPTLSPPLSDSPHPVRPIKSEVSSVHTPADVSVSLLPARLSCPLSHHPRATVFLDNDADACPLDVDNALRAVSSLVQRRHVSTGRAFPSTQTLGYQLVFPDRIPQSLSPRHPHPSPFPLLFSSALSVVLLSTFSL
ncbi:hypothetical protein CONPUDRAFT_150150 [Coniophora puteana RWD-64-598 SS2]|uniref:Uncharacterized protein n=1 Tax=Coniophora puteana (strain RWD-64-598) TaxID=741705 RepID=A0A5M3N1S6_CONPW|nr:uncharacterized protein CONPUDRAFT_150150 [Coniophora puteana RWD-64-598 SS2]EIW85339.1 hypothetical protein CONPUDRAFT_150150 [Coniophora puteana RWD-64-598 SS2]